MKKLILLLLILLNSKNILAAERFSKVIIIVFENTNYSDALKAGFFNKLANDGVLFTNFYAQGRPSQPNYLAMISGSTWGHYSNEWVDINQRTIVDLLEEKNKTWASYAEYYPGNCHTGNSGDYVRKHNPFISFTTISKNPQRCKNIKNLEEMFIDWNLNNLPNYSFVIPGNSSNGHNTGIGYAANWFEKTFSKYMYDEQKMKDTLFIITFDEAGLSLTNQIYTVFFGPSIKSGVKNRHEHTHYSLLKLLQDEWGLQSLFQQDDYAPKIDGIWQ
ncbi:MAG: hypothetical protein IPM57_03020 [Oligoflexia bacterium]|nr:hypothetical protein [Oligoflexia bacterium]